MNISTKEEQPNFVALVMFPRKFTTLCEQIQNFGGDTPSQVKLKKVKKFTWKVVGI